MASTEQWIAHAEAFGARYRRDGRAKFLAVAQGCCRYYRDVRHLERVPELSNADHYWFGRWVCFAASAIGNLAGHGDAWAVRPVGSREQAPDNPVAQVLGSSVAYLATAAGMTFGNAVWTIGKALLMSGVPPWVRADPGWWGRSTSEPTAAQWYWGQMGMADALVQDFGYLPRSISLDEIFPDMGNLPWPAPLR